METTKLSSKGQVVIPKPVRTAHHWEVGQELVVMDTEEGVLLKPLSPFTERGIDEVASSLQYSGKAKTVDEMKEAIKTGVEKTFQ